jgi:hypothetical protein
MIFVPITTLREAAWPAPMTVIGGESRLLPVRFSRINQKE